MQRIFYLAFTAFFLLATAAWGKPTGAMVKSVLDHYNSGREVVLVEAVFCSDIIRDGEHLNECADRIDPASIRQGAKVYLWMNYMVPKNTTPQVLLQYTIDGRTLKTRNLSLSGSLRYRTWALIPTDRTGVWQIRLEQDENGHFIPVDTLAFTVNPPPN